MIVEKIFVDTSENIIYRLDVSNNAAKLKVGYPLLITLNLNYSLVKQMEDQV